MDRFRKTWLLCFAVITITSCDDNNHRTSCEKIYKLEALPGHGWDSLRNKELGRVFEFTYDQCRTTEDGVYLIPDSVHAVAIKDSNLETTAELIEHYMNYSSLTSASFDIGVGFHLSKIGADASFDSDFLYAKTRQVNEKSMTTRIQARNNVYMIQSSPDAKIEPALKSMLDRVVEATQSDNLRKAKLLCQFIVRDYGTHYIDQANAGAILLKEDYISSSLVANKAVTKLSIQAAAGAEFFTFFSAHSKFSSNVDVQFQDTYKKSKTSSHVRSIGGAMLSSNLTLDDWTNQIGNNLVVIDRSGDPLSYLVNPERFPNVPVETLNTVRKLLDNVTQQYYAHNAHYGCTDINSPNFDFNANVDSNDCQNFNNFTFGAGYMTCTSSQTENGDLCDGYNVKNPLTGAFTCDVGYDPVPLTSHTKNSQSSSEECSGWWLWRNCYLKTSYSASTYQGFWCVVSNSKPNATTPTPSNSGAMFGGLFTSRTNNPLTKAKKCPVSFIDLRLADDLHVCVSNAYDDARGYSAPFGGFFTCVNGNPLTTAPDMFQNKSLVVQGKRNLRTCPPGFSQRVAAIENDCLINYCTKLQSTIGPIKIVLPPFQSQSALFVDNYGENSLNLAIAADAGKDSMSGGIVALIVVVAFAVLVLMVVGVLVVKRRRVKRSSSSEETLQHPDGYDVMA